MICERFGVDLVNGKYDDDYSDGFYKLGTDRIQAWIRRPIPRAEGIADGACGAYFPDERLYVLIKVGPTKSDWMGRAAYWLRAAVMTEDQYFKVSAHPQYVFPLLKRNIKLSRKRLVVNSEFMPEFDESYLHLYNFLLALPVESRLINFRIGKFFTLPPNVEKYDLTL